MSSKKLKVTYDAGILIFSSGYFEFRMRKYPDKEKWTELADACKHKMTKILNFYGCCVNISVNPEVIEFCISNCDDFDNRCDGEIKYRMKPKNCEMAFREAARIIYFR